MRKQIAKDTLQYIEQGYYIYHDKKVIIADAQKASEQSSCLIEPHVGRKLITDARKLPEIMDASVELKNQSTVKTILELKNSGAKGINVLNFASAKNPGGGFINGAMAQEESLAASGGLYATQILHKEYYESNRNCKSMMYLDYGIYSPDTVFFRDDNFKLLESPVTASVLTLPAVNYGQVILKGEDREQAKKVMRNRMELALAVFAHFKAENLVLGAYGCGVFRNDPKEVAKWWRELLEEDNYKRLFHKIVFAVMDHSRNNDCINGFQHYFRIAE